MRVALICLSLTVMVSCATYKGQVKPSDIAVIAKNGTSGLLFGTYTRNFSELMRSPAVQLIVENSSGHTYDLYLKMPEKNKKGVFVFELPAGSYVIDRVMYQYNDPGNYYIKKLSLPVIIKAKKISYVGSLSFQTGSVSGALRTEVSKDFEHDKNIFESVFTDKSLFTYIK